MSMECAQSHGLGRHCLYSSSFTSSYISSLGLSKERRQEQACEWMGSDELSRTQTTREHLLGTSMGEECSGAQLILFCQDPQSLEILPSYCFTYHDFPCTGPPWAGEVRNVSDRGP